MKVKVKARLGYADLFESTTFQGTGKPYYQAQFIIEKDSDEDKAIRDAIKTAATEKWKDKATGALKSVNNNKNLCCYVDGDIAGFDEDQMLLTAKRYEEDGRPDIRDRDASPLSAKDGRPYPGCHAIGIVEIWMQDNNYGKGVRCQLLGVQFLKDGDPMKKSAKASESDFEDLGVLEDDEMFA